MLGDLAEASAHHWLQRTPVNLFGAAMGLAGLTAVYQQAIPLLNFHPLIASGLLASSLLLFAVVSLVYLAKCWFFYEDVRAEFNHPVGLCFFSTISISLLLLAHALQGLHFSYAQGLWLGASLVHLLFTLYQMSQWMHRCKFEAKHHAPVLSLPVMGCLVVPLSGEAFGYTEVAWFFFALGLLLWLLLTGLLLNRLIFHSSVEDTLLQSVLMMLALPALATVSYLNLVGTVDLLVRILYAWMLFVSLLLLTQVGSLTRQHFALSWWAYAFPLSCASLAVLSLYTFTQSALFHGLAFFFVYLTSIVATLIGIKTLESVIDGYLQ